MSLQTLTEKELVLLFLQLNRCYLRHLCRPIGEYLIDPELIAIIEQLDLVIHEVQRRRVDRHAPCPHSYIGPDKYEQKVQINGTFGDVTKVAVSNHKKPKEKSVKKKK